MDWAEITLKVPTEFTDEAAAIANMAVPYGIYIEDYSDLEKGAEEIAHIDLIDEDLINSDRNHSVIHIYISKENNIAKVPNILKKGLTVVIFLLNSVKVQFRKKNGKITGNSFLNVRK